ncbi:DUF2807 domain-containing protein [Subsaximicrobium wynnwilliamsii]|uniref:DUF2807 domain-containing protein n=1 Tax=Subsaximicrobium wynnwilliamsii TaxID=291179 RepID=A0A5C6ZE32_9FLAO|nr:head GIN domain-containing protein [Subsaximicrobium wynnwilliamsii]TXD83306.1 DUF2807 domain-containing protein [Subsaximicrobium wynnwilliamsii]TXD87405.1 DUF2807 domain-containing protein [Subsaximicrobium wynnwilliamsii]TXE03329.1 DUF2807 domain-containing protein [Subsaximicrobium wynnwilliamsii]
MKSLILALASLATFSCAQGKWGNNAIKGNGNLKTITRTTSDYDAIHCAGSFDYILVEGTEGDIKIEGEENLLEYIITEVQNGTLSITTENNVNLNTSTNKGIKITIPFKEITEVSLSGSGDLWNTDVIDTNNLSASISGSGDVVLEIKTTSAKARISGSGDLTFTGTTEKLEANVTGSGNFHGFDIRSQDVNVSVTGSGDAAVFSTNKLIARVTGSGDIEFRGNPKTEDTKVTGSGSIGK